MIFRINRVERTAIRLTPPYCKDAQAASYNFHPFKSMAVFNSLEDEGWDTNFCRDRAHLVPANELSLSIVHLKKDEFVPLEPLQMTNRVRSKLYVAETGDFLLLEGFTEQDVWPRELLRHPVSITTPTRHTRQ